MSATVHVIARLTARPEAVAALQALLTGLLELLPVRCSPRPWSIGYTVIDDLNLPGLGRAGSEPRLVRIRCMASASFSSGGF